MIKKAFVPKIDISDYDIRKTICGLKSLAIPVEEIENIEKINEENDYMVVGSVNRLREWRKLYKIKNNFCGDFPEQLKDFYGRKIEKKTMKELFYLQEEKFLFIKPFYKGLFSPFVAQFPLLKYNDATALLHISEESLIYVQDVISFVAEWRCFMLNGNVVDVRRYNGNWKHNFKSEFIEEIAKIDIGHHAYCFDIGLTASNQMYLIEINRAESFGSYGLNPLSYAEMQLTWWNDLWINERSCA